MTPQQAVALSIGIIWYVTTGGLVAFLFCEHLVSSKRSVLKTDFWLIYRDGRTVPRVRYYIVGLIVWILWFPICAGYVAVEVGKSLWKFIRRNK